MKIKDRNQIIKPFLRWAGGKNWFRKHIDEYLPETFNNYYEPFLGGGSIFFYLKSKGLIKNNAYLSDSNPELINTYEIIKNNLSDLIPILKQHKNSEEEYYVMRKQIFDNPIEKAAQFIFLNKTSFNGLYRVNQKGEYNVPYGNRNLNQLYDYDHLEVISNSFDNTFFSCEDFKISCNKVENNDFIFIDPPYTVAHENNGFVQYNQSIFSWENQIQLSQITSVLNDKGAKFLVTNALHNSIKELYVIGNQFPISRSSTIGGKGAKRTNFNEIIITNTLL